MNDSTATTSSRSGPGRQSPPSTPESVKETIESILIAFILAFVFREFVVEAFVIPTGSMAPTLLGAHMRFRCEDCGYQFDVNYSKHSSNRDDQDIPKTSGGSYSMHCPNCGLKVNQETATNSPVYYGDRILVLKYLYVFEQPRRWDVVVFKSPDNQSNQPEDYYSTNYIKRLVGRPGESIMVLDGDVYVSSNTKEPYEWKCATKPRFVQDALWRVVHDVDFQPHRKGWSNQWYTSAGAGWANTENSKLWQFNGASGVLTFNNTARRGYAPFTDWLPYDETLNQFGQSYDLEAYHGGMGQEEIPSWNVNDLKISCFYQRQNGDGPFRLKLTKRGHQFTAQFDRDHASLWHRDPTMPLDSLGKQVGKDIPLKSTSTSAPVQIDFMNVDFQVTLRIDDEDVLQTTTDDYQPDVAQMIADYKSSIPSRSLSPLPTVSIDAANQTCSVAHLSLWRDIYYTPRGYRENLKWALPTDPIVLKSRANGAPEDEYFVMGDNSILSYDAHLWTVPIDLKAAENLAVDGGRVPGRFMIGRAFFVYWPAGHRPFNPKSWPGIIPNFGDMRFIH